MKKVLFIDRDGTLIKEPPVDYQVDSLEKLEFMPGVFRNLYKLRHFTDYELVVVSNQDGLGTESFPEADFKAPHEKFLEAFKNEGVEFDADNSGYGLFSEFHVPAEETIVETSCRMRRPRR